MVAEVSILLHNMPSTLTVWYRSCGYAVSVAAPYLEVVAGLWVMSRVSTMSSKAPVSVHSTHVLSSMMSFNDLLSIMN